MVIYLFLLLSSWNYICFNLKSYLPTLLSVVFPLHWLADFNLLPVNVIPLLPKKCLVGFFWNLFFCPPRWNEKEKRRLALVAECVSGLSLPPDPPQSSLWEELLECQKFAFLPNNTNQVNIAIRFCQSAQTLILYYFKLDVVLKTFLWVMSLTRPQHLTIEVQVQTPAVLWLFL